MGGSPSVRTLVGDELLRLAKRNNLTTFVETGTYRAETALWAARLFDLVFTIEKDETLYRAALKHGNNTSNLHCFLGDSPEVLKNILPYVENAIFWLDAHPMGDPEAVSPVLRELDVIARDYGTPAVMLIDDVLFFEMHAPGWPTLDEVKEKIASMGMTYRKENDVIIAEKSVQE